ncbi:MAG: hypothetical protein JWR85_3633 [Marmoricola sp.]|nr:hypothetical protein [Marmoricola sp.]
MLWGHCELRLPGAMLDITKIANMFVKETYLTWDAPKRSCPQDQSFTIGAFNGDSAHA